jgi:hypothetical protein
LLIGPVALAVASALMSLVVVAIVGAGSCTIMHDDA